MADATPQALSKGAVIDSITIRGMEMVPAGTPVDVSAGHVEFGSFTLHATERRLLRDKVPVPLGSRALDILILLVANAGNVVTKQELIDRVWPGITIDDSALRVHIAGLRKILGESDEARYIVNVAGRGYSFVGQVRQAVYRPAAPYSVTPLRNGGQLPPSPASITGREADIDGILELLAHRRFVTVHGAAGIGKTTAAVAAANKLRDRFDDEILFLDLGIHGRGESVPDILAAALGQIVQSSAQIDNIIRHLRDRRMLLVFDCCEHVIESAAALAETIFENAPDVSILATSREPLHVEGEHVFALQPLSTPSEDMIVNSLNLLDYSAARLLVERAVAGGHQIELNDESARTIADICRKVDGIALALELTARRIGTHGLRETASLIDSHLSLSWPGRRTAMPRHQTLHATMDWGHGLLLRREQTVLRRLSIFVGPFTLAEAQAVAGTGDFDGSEVVEAMTQLVSKSLVIATPSENGVTYRLLDAMRVYAGIKLSESGERRIIAWQHASYYRRRLSADPMKLAMASDLVHLGNIRAALEWSFSDSGDTELGVRLAASSAYLFLVRSLLAECNSWSERALSVLPDHMRGTHDEMALCATLGRALMFVVGNDARVLRLIERALEIAETLEDDVREFQLLTVLHIFHRRAADFQQLLPLAERAEKVAARLASGDIKAAANVMLGASYHLIGRLAEAKASLDMALLRPPTPQDIRTNSLDLYSEAHFVLARNTWLQGFPDSCLDMLGEAERDTLKFPIVACNALILGATVHHFRQDWRAFEGHVDQLIQCSEEYCLNPYKSLASGFKGEVLFHRGEVEAGLGMIRDALARMRAEKFEIYASWLGCTLAEGMAARGHTDHALSISQEIIDRVTEGGSAFNMPEILRIKGEVLVKAGALREAEECFEQSIAAADRQGALSWRLRTATSLGRALFAQGRREGARHLLSETYSRFTEGFDTADLISAKLLLDELGT